MKSCAWVSSLLLRICRPLRQSGAGWPETTRCRQTPRRDPHSKLGGMSLRDQCAPERVSRDTPGSTCLLGRPLSEGSPATASRAKAPGLDSGLSLGLSPPMCPSGGDFRYGFFQCGPLLRGSIRAGGRRIGKEKQIRLSSICPTGRGRVLPRGHPWHSHVAREASSDRAQFCHALDEVGAITAGGIPLLRARDVPGEEGKRHLVASECQNHRELRAPPKQAISQTRNRPEFAEPWFGGNTILGHCGLLEEGQVPLRERQVHPSDKTHTKYALPAAVRRSRGDQCGF